MGQIKTDVSVYLRAYPNEKPVFKPFLFNFDVNFAKKFQILGTTFSAYILSPDEGMKTSFAFEDELLLIVHPYTSMQPRILQAVEIVFKSEPFKSRVDPLTYFLVSRDDNVEEWSSNYLMSHPQSRTPISISLTAVDANKDDRWFIRNQLSSQLYNKDLFDYTLPLDDDLLFFGRKSVIDDFISAVRKGQNRGLFGLRKTGKTSLLFKLARDVKNLNVAKVLYLDCKRPDLRSLSWQSLLELIAKEVAELCDKKYISTKEPVKNLARLISNIEANDKICVIFDEIEYISPLAHIDKHWKDDFLPFWQTLWSIQSEHRKISFVVAGVNPYLCEIDLINRVQNPMFSIIRPTYLTGLSADEVAQMIRAIGGRMGLGFDIDSINYLNARYGGHPLLTRMACSHTNQISSHKGLSRPLGITRKWLAAEENDREDELYFYCRAVVSELQEFYEDEYELLEMLATGNITDFNELAAEPGWIKHLKSYGIIDIANSGKPTFRIPVIQRYVGNEKARRNKTREIRSVIDGEKRAAWIEIRRYNVLHDLKSMLRNISAKGMWQPYGSSFLPEADLLARIRVAFDWDSFNSFITEINKCLVETIDITHTKSGFFNRLKNTYPDFFDALHRIRLLRNNADHLRLDARVEESLQSYLRRDLFGRSLTKIDEPWFVLQQVVLDELFAAVQYENAKII